MDCRDCAIYGFGSPRKLARLIEYKSMNDLLVYHFTVPTINPEIEIQVPEELEYSVEFGTPAENIEKLRYTSRKRLVGTYFPHQHMTARWWPKAKPS